MENWNAFEMTEWRALTAKKLVQNRGLNCTWDDQVNVLGKCKVSSHSNYNMTLMQFWVKCHKPRKQRSARKPNLQVAVEKGGGAIVKALYRLALCACCIHLGSHPCCQTLPNHQQLHVIQDTMETDFFQQHPCKPKWPWHMHFPPWPSSCLLAAILLTLC